MRVFSKSTLRNFWEDPKHSKAKGPLLEWYKVVTRAKWHRFADLKNTYNSCDQVGSKIVFDVGGNHYRIIAVVRFESQQVYIRAVLDHKDYDKGSWKDDTFGDDWKPDKKKKTRD